MIDVSTWKTFRDKLHSIRMHGKLIKYIGIPSKIPVYVTGIPLKSDRIFLGNNKDHSIGSANFVSVTHMNSSFSIDGKLIGDYMI